MITLIVDMFIVIDSCHYFYDTVAVGLVFTWL
jgi:hypothetical protein